MKKFFFLTFCLGTFFLWTPLFSEEIGTAELPLPPTSKGLSFRKDMRSSQKKIENISFSNGDIVFIRSTSLQSKALEEVTQTHWTHVGVLFRLIQEDKEGKDNKARYWKLASSQNKSQNKQGKWYVFEANSQVQFTPLEKFVGSRSHAFLRMKDPLSEAQVALLFEVALGRLGKAYDLYFLLSRDGVHKDDFDYCSELVWYVFAKGIRIPLGERVLLGSLNTKGQEAEKLVKKRFAQNAPLSLTEWQKQYVIPPQSIFESPLLRRIDL
jgi:hypothetical protein